MLRFLCALTDWEESTLSVGKNKGKKVQNRTVIAADTWCWAICIETKGIALLKPYSFHGNMKNMCTVLNDIPGAISKIIDALSKITGREKPEKLPSKSSSIGLVIDNQFGTSFMREYPPKVVSRLFNETVDENDENEETEENEVEA